MTEMFPPHDDHPEVVGDGQQYLTRIRDPYTLATTPDGGSETDRLMINNFLTTLAEIALAVASRNLSDKQEGGIQV